MNTNASDPSRDIKDQIEAACKLAGCNCFYPRNTNGEIGHIDFYGPNRSMDAALQMCGVRITNHRSVSDVPAPFDRADLMDADGTKRGSILYGADGRGSADLSYALTRPLTCFSIVNE